MQLSLSLLEAGVLLVDYIQSPFSSYNFAICTAFFYGCPDFHFYSVFVYQRLAFSVNYLYLKMILPLVKSYGLISTPTLSPGRILI